MGGKKIKFYKFDPLCEFSVKGETHFPECFLLKISCFTFSSD